jgi:hypothetical protein
MPPFDQIHIIMKSSILYFLALSILGGTLVTIQGDEWCGHGNTTPVRPPLINCVCDEGYVSSVPSSNCFDVGASGIQRLYSTYRCDTPCNWKKNGNPYTNYSCIIAAYSIC